ncbi:MAG: hypothetical protein AAFR73_09120 [Pseudomonadota bacterium]
MFTSTADVFRTRQAVADLLEIVRLHRDAVNRIGASNADMASIKSIVLNDGVIPDDGSRSYSSILLAAAMPDEDFAAFVASTGILLADRLQSAGGEDDLFWNFEAFHDHYLLADVPQRAALMNGFRLLHTSGRVRLLQPPEDRFCLSRSELDVLQVLEGEKAIHLTDLLVAAPSPEEAGQRWEAIAGKRKSFADQIAFRYLYERPESIKPVSASGAPIISWA